MNLFLKHTVQAAATLATLVCSSQAFALWKLDVDVSEIGFVSIKALDIAESHRFGYVDGRITDEGNAVVAADLATVETGIPIRDERMRDLLFEAADHPLATIRSMVEMTVFDELAVGEQINLQLPITVEMHEVRQELEQRRGIPTEAAAQPA